MDDLRRDGNWQRRTGPNNTQHSRYRLAGLGKAVDYRDQSTRVES
jgi:hypothetical protein